jgi:hypothetical protein
MGETEYKCADATRKELCDAARKHYDEISIEAMHYSTTIAHAIDAYEREPDLKQQLTTAQEENVRLRRVIDGCLNYKSTCAETREKMRQALSTPPSGGLSELVEAVGALHGESGHEYDQRTASAIANVVQAYNKVIGGE